MQGTHDAAAVLLEDGHVVAAIEEERLARHKHSNMFPIGAMRFCLETRGVSLAEIDRIAMSSTESDIAFWYNHVSLATRRDLGGPRRYIARLIERELGQAVDEGKIAFVHHQMAHAHSAFAYSGFDEALVLTLDGEGDHEAGRVLVGNARGLELERPISFSNSLGLFYLAAIAVLGYRHHDEYKVMGLAPYGDAGKYRGLLRSCYELRGAGDFVIHPTTSHRILAGFPREQFMPSPAAEYSQDHKDLAASIQEALEDIVFHLVRHYRERTGLKNFCFAGGVAHNCTLNGKIMHSGMFERMFVQPVAHDPGCCLGAALSLSFDPALGPPRKVRLPHLYWGTDIGADAAIAHTLQGWSDFVTFEKVDDPEAEAARLLAAGSIIGWVQGRSEFGPRALGNRSILADARPAENKTVINAMVKKREGYRPFAPAVCIEDAADYFDIPSAVDGMPFMIYVTNVRPAKRELLGAVTHVDGTARVQTVSREGNDRFWRLLQAFKQRTGVPVLLNTSFNNNAEPIVDSVDDAVVCFLTTTLHHLVVGSYRVERKPDAALGRLVPSLPWHVTLHEERFDQAGSAQRELWLRSRQVKDEVSCTLSPEAHRVLSRADGRTRLGALIDQAHVGAAGELLAEVRELWSRRLVTLLPARERV
jgi:carbamoyltransferase